MTDRDASEFSALFRRVAGVYRARVDEDVASTYFRVLRPFALADLERAADAWIAKEARFPKPAEWRGSLSPDASQVRDLRVMTWLEGKEYADAERRGYEGDPCGCGACRDTGVDHRFLRFVPEFTAHDTDLKVFDPVRQREVTAGHWAHGQELARWYVTKDAFWQKCADLGFMEKISVKPKASKLSFEQQLENIFRRTASVPQADVQESPNEITPPDA